MPAKKDEKPWETNSVSLAERVVCLLLGLLLVARGASGFLHAKLDLAPPRQTKGIILEGGPAWLMAAAVIVGASVLISVVIDHHDRRNNEKGYRLFRRGSIALGLCLVAASLISFLFNALRG